MVPHNREAGQTLLETIIAIGIILVGVLGTIALVIANMQAARQGIDRVTAANLAREGLEVVRNMRDGNWLQSKTSSSDWTTGFIGQANDAIPAFNSTTFQWSLDFTIDGQPDLTTAPGAQVFQMDDDSHLFLQPQQGVSVATPYYRIIEFTPSLGGDDNKLGIVARVEWKERGVKHKVILEDHLTNWY